MPHPADHASETWHRKLGVGMTSSQPPTTYSAFRAGWDRRPPASLVRAGTPESLWCGPGPRRMRSHHVARARRIIALNSDGTYTVVKSSEAGNFKPIEAVVFIYEEVK